MRVMNKKSVRIVALFFQTMLRIAIAYLIIITVYKFSFQAYDFGFAVFADEAVSVGEGHDVTVSIVEGKSPREIGKILEESGVIKDANVFWVQERLSDYHNLLKPGVYHLSTSMKSGQILDILGAGPEAQKAAEEAAKEESEGNQ